MPKLTRKQRRSKAGPTPPAVATKRPVRRGREYSQVFCPCCGRSQGQVDFWQRTLEYDPQKPFGVVQDVGQGRGRSFQVVRYLNPGDVPELFDLVKRRLLQAIQQWRARGWLTEEPGTTPSKPPLPVPTPMEQPVTEPASELALIISKWQRAKVRSSPRAEADLDTLEEQGFDVAEAREALEDYGGVERSDYDSAEEYGEARTEAWDAFTESLNSIELEEAEEGEP